MDEIPQCGLEGVVSQGCGGVQGIVMAVNGIDAPSEWGSVIRSVPPVTDPFEDDERQQE